MRLRALYLLAFVGLAATLNATEPITISTIHGNWQGYYARPKTKPEPMLANFRVDGVEFEGKFYLYPKLPKKKKFPAQEFKLRDGETDVAKGSVLFDRMVAKKKPSPCSGVFSHRGLILEGTCQEGKGKAKFKIWRTQDQGDSSMVYMDQQNFDYFLKMAQDWDKGIGLPWYFADAPAPASAPVQEQPTAVPTLEPTPTTVAAEPGNPTMAGEWDVQLLLPGEGPQPMAGYWELTQTGDEFSGTGSDGAHELKLEQGKLNPDGVFRVNRIIDLGIGPAEKTPFYGRLSADGKEAKGSWLMHDQSTKSIFTMRRRVSQPAVEAQP